MKSPRPLAELLAETLAGLKASVDGIRDPRAYDRRNQEIREIERKGLEAIPSDRKVSRAGRPTHGHDTVP